jgi:hypothetical protein
MACPSGGAVKLTQSGQVLQNVDLGDCGIDISATGVVVRNVRAHSTWVDGYLAIVRKGASATFTDVELFGNGAGSSSVEYTIFGPEATSVTITRANLYNCADCVQGEHVVMTDSYIHDMANPSGAHPDAFQCNATCSGTVLRHNRIENKTNNNMGVSLFCDFGTPSGAVIDHNLIDMGGGGSYAIWACGRNHTVTNNVIVPAFYGWLGIPSGSGSGDLITGNTKPDGTPLT